MIADNWLGNLFLTLENIFFNLRTLFWINLVCNNKKNLNFNIIFAERSHKFIQPLVLCHFIWIFTVTQVFLAFTFQFTKVSSSFCFDAKLSRNSFWRHFVFLLLQASNSRVKTHFSANSNTKWKMWKFHRRENSTHAPWTCAEKSRECCTLSQRGRNEKLFGVENSGRMFKKEWNLAWNFLQNCRELW